MIDRLYSWTASHRLLFLRLFWLVNIFLTLLIGLGYRSLVLGVGDPSIWYLIGSKAADLAVLFLVAASIPGIARRFHLTHKLVMILMLFRRQLGIATFMFALVHVCFITIFPEIHAHAPLVAIDPQNLAGWGAFILLIPIFITSNDTSVHQLGIWWHRIHALVYGLVWVLVAHTFFSEESWFFLITVAATAEVASFVYVRARKR